MSADRAAFERYFAESRKSKGPSRRPTFERLADGTYADDHTQRHWWTWQQAASPQPAPGFHAYGHADSMTDTYPLASPQPQPAPESLRDHAVYAMAARAEITREQVEGLPRKLFDVASRIRAGESLHRDDEMVDQAAHAIKAALVLHVPQQPAPKTDNGDPDNCEHFCPNCGGSVEVADSAGPDARMVPVDCPHCGGNGLLNSAYHGVVKLLAAEHGKYMSVCAELNWRKQQPAPLTEERMHEVLGNAGPDLLALAQKWADNKIHTFQFANEAESVVIAVLARAGIK